MLPTLLAILLLTLDLPCAFLSHQLCIYLSLVNTLSWLSLLLSLLHTVLPWNASETSCRIYLLILFRHELWTFPSIMICVAKTTKSLEKFRKIFREAAKLVNQSKIPRAASSLTCFLFPGPRKILTILFSICAFLQVFETQKKITPSTCKQIIF